MVGFARLITHYFSHAAWLADDELPGSAHRLAGIQGVLLHGRLDLSGPPDVAWALTQAWPAAELSFVPGGHTGDEAMDRLPLTAIDRFAST
jgi:proline iminopeptidase